MSRVYGEPDPHATSVRGASPHVAPIATSAVTESVTTSQRSAIKPKERSMRAAAKKRTMCSESIVSKIDNSCGKSYDNHQSDRHHSRCLLYQKKKLSGYDEALGLLKNNPPEQVLDITLPYSKYLLLEKAYSKIKKEADISDDQRYPYLSYNSFTNTASVVTVPSSLHDASVDAYLSSHPQARDSILPVGSTTTYDFNGAYANTTKQPDGGFCYEPRGGEAQLTIAIEVGASETYQKLLKDKDIWIDGHGVKVCILVCLIESPRFRNPETRYENIDVGKERAMMAQRTAEVVERNGIQGHYGPISYRGHNWIGELDEAFIEIWRPDTTDCVRCVSIVKELVLGRVAYEDLATTLGLRIKDFFPDHEFEIVNIPDSEIPFDGARFVYKLMNAMARTEKLRFNKFIG
ncbi:hypothetical protein V1508DRAFT_398740 [Lipomyces doorenjongii]|uniref:uncharacterized protein n=1 Tax=Lipomyces doorenjongii TaxID=383834 RepID=UPI0034CD74FA